MTNPKQFSRKEIAERNTKADAVFVIENNVYDVTKFLDDHPGGHEVLMQVAGKDASEEFDDVGHSLDAKELMKKYLIGEVEEADKIHKNKRENAWTPVAETSSSDSFFSSWKFPVAMGLLITVLYTYLFG